MEMLTLVLELFDACFRAQIELVENTAATVANWVRWKRSDAAETQSVELKRCLTWYCETLVSWFGFGTAADTDFMMHLWYHLMVP